MKAFFSYLAVAVLIVTIACWTCQYVYDGDNFYHLGHAGLYAQHGPFYRPFPWVTYSVISQYNSDIWWGFHLLLSPITLLGDKVLVLAAAPGVLMVLNLLISRLAVIKLGMSHWYGLALLPASFGYLTRMDTVRPQVLSSALLVLLFAAFVVEAPWLAIGASIALGLLHPTLSYMIIMVGICTIIQRRISTGKFNPWTELSCLVVALAVSCIRPGMLDGLSELKVQLWDLMQVRRAGEIKNFGVELDKVNMGYFIRAYISPLVMLALGLVVLWRFRDKEKSLSPFWAGLGVVLAATLLSVLITRRGIDQFAPFTILTALLLFHSCKGIPKFTAIVFALHGCYVFALWEIQNYQRDHRINATDFRAACAWLEKNTTPGEIVGQAVWSDFGPLFYWNPHNRYLGGMDPIFQYRFNPETYWLMTINCAGREPGSTSKYNPLKVTDNEEPISTVWPRDLHTKWLLCSPSWNTGLQEALMKDTKVKIAYEDKHAKIYEFLP